MTARGATRTFPTEAPRSAAGTFASGLFLGAILSGGLLLSSCSTDIATPLDRYAIVIGVQDYPTPGDPGDPGNYDLNYPDDDAADMKTLLEERGWTVTATLIDSSDAAIISDGQATKANIEAAIADLADLASQSDFDANSTVLVYYSGHGSVSLDGETAYVIPYDGITSGGGSDISNWITPAELSQWLGALDCSNKMLILDSCYSGGFVDTGDSVDAAPANYGPYDDGTAASTFLISLANLGALLAESVSDYGDPAVLTISAAGAEEFSYDDDGSQHGAFTYYLLQAATKGDSNGDGYVTATEAYAYAKKKIQDVWNASYANITSQEAAYYAMINDGLVPDFLPHISGGAGDLVLYAK